MRGDPSFYNERTRNKHLGQRQTSKARNISKIEVSSAEISVQSATNRARVRPLIKHFCQPNFLRILMACLVN